MKTNEVKRINLLEQVTAGNNCSCIVTGGDLSYPKRAFTTTDCRIACCAPVSLYVHSYNWMGKKYKCFDSVEDYGLFISWLPSLKSSGLYDAKWERIYAKSQ